MPKRFSRWWLIACIIVCSNAYPARQEIKPVNYGSFSSIGDSSAASTDYDFNDSIEKFVDRIDESNNDQSEVDGTSSTTARNKYVRLPLVLEPDAEMLPAHYTGVKPPGVDHMEIRYLDSATLGSDRKNSLVDGTKAKDHKNSGGDAIATGLQAVRGSKGKSGTQRNVAFVKSLKGNEFKEIQKGAYDESAGKKKDQQEGRKHSTDHEDVAVGEKSVSYKNDRHGEKDRNAAGYHNVYHKDEYKKDADYYDNDNQGGRFHKHGHYGEKHVASEGDFRKSDKQNSGLAHTDAGKKGNFERGRKAEATNGRASKSGYDRFFGKFEEFTNKAAAPTKSL